MSLVALRGRVLIDTAARWAEPSDVLHRVAGRGAFLLEAGAGGRWSYLAPWPEAVLERQAPGAGAFAAVRRLLARVDVERPPGAPPFIGGLVGSFGYDLARGLERLPTIAQDELGLAAMRLHLVSDVLAFDHERREVLLLSRAQERLELLREAVETGAHYVDRRLPPPGAMRCMPYQRYRGLVERVLGHIERGDVYQVNLTHRLDGVCSDALGLYSRLRRLAAVPYNLYLEAGAFTMVGASPERFLSARPDGEIVTRPIKGTRPRGDTPTADAALAAELAASAKDRAENVMIVDLARNDLGRVCQPGTVRVASLWAVEQHPTVHQLVSEVRGRLAPGHDVVDAIAAAFPPGSMTGCPKVRAMQLIEELEPVRRGPYAGAFGWVGPDGACDLAVVIRTAVIRNGSVHVHVGGAIVADSTPDDEYEESLLKARALAVALGASIVPV